MTKHEDRHLARAFRALSHPRRAALFRLLAEHPCAGASYRQLQVSSRLCTSSLTHHIREMERCGLIRRRRKGGTVAYLLEPASLGTALSETERLLRRAARPIGRVA